MSYSSRGVVEEVSVDVKIQEWFAVYTHPRAEKQIVSRLTEKGVHAWIPIQRTIRQWSDRKKTIEIPLLRSYVFVNISKQQYYEVLKTPGIVKYVCIEGKAAAIPEKQIDNLKLLVDSNYNIEIEQKKFSPGQKVIVSYGTLKGLTGELIKKGRKHRMLVRIENIDQNLLVNIPVGFLEHVH